MRRAPLVLATLLCASVALNLVLWLNPAPGTGSAETALPVPSDRVTGPVTARAAKGPTSLSLTQPSACAGCTARLVACRNALKATPDDGEPGGNASGRVEAFDDATVGGFDALPEADAQLQLATLDEMARAHFRSHWREKGKELAPQFRKDLGDPERVSLRIEEEVARLANLLEVDGPELETLLSGYRAIRAPAAARVATALGEQPPDYLGVVDELHAYFAAEDQLVEELHGPDGLRRLRAYQLEPRTVLLAIFAALADEPWGDEIVW